MSNFGLPPAPQSRPRVLITTDFYVPGYRGGGPIRTISNLIDHLGDVFDFSIVTGDRDLGADRPYADVRMNAWEARGNSRVLYQTHDRRSLRGWVRLLRETPHDILLLNSLYSRATIRLLTLRRLRAIPPRPTIVAPRGELSPGAARLKRWRKRVFLTAARRLGLFDGLIWQASSELERGEILDALGGGVAARDRTPPNGRRPTQVRVAIDLPPRIQPLSHGRRVKVPGDAHIVFISRLARNKNLSFAFDALAKVEGRVSFDIYGPLEDARYWSECAALMSALPTHVTARYCGEVDPAAVVPLFAGYDLFLFPTLSENFGHVVLEALTAGCPVLMSDTTPWRNLTERMAGWDVPLAEPERFVSILQQVISMDDAAHRRWSEGARAVAEAVSSDEGAVKANRLLFAEALATADAEIRALGRNQGLSDGSA